MVEFKINTEGKWDVFINGKKNNQQGYTTLVKALFKTYKYFKSQE